MKILTIVGARPQFIKAAPISKALLECGIEEVLLHTGQHYDYKMSEIFFEELGLAAPRYNLALGGGSHGAMTGRMLEKIEEVALTQKPNWMMVYGDTNSTLAGALAGAKLRLPIAHVEAGLRSWNRNMPEEINRVLTDHVSNLLFCSSRVGLDNLAKEGITQGVHIVGDVMADSNRIARRIIDAAPAKFLSKLPSGIEVRGFGLLTLHRAENTDDPERLGAIVNGLNQLSIPLLFPVHPRTSIALGRIHAGLGSHVHRIDPLGYLEMTALLSASKVVITDSGGLQKEAYWSGIPCVTLRNETEWIETLQDGWNQLAGTGADLATRVARAITLTGSRPPLYGDGSAASKVAKLFLRG